MNPPRVTRLKDLRVNYHSGLTPPLKRVVERRFQAREHKNVAPPKHEVNEVEKELQNLISSISKDSNKAKGKGKGNQSKKSTSLTNVNKIIEDVVEDIVDYKPWMDDYGRQPYGIEFDEKDLMCTKHPELWLDHEDEAEAAKEAEIAEAKKKEERKEKKKNRGGAVDAPTKLQTESSSDKKSESTKKSKKEDGKKKGKKKKKDKDAASQQQSDHKQGIAAKKTRDDIDEVTKIATRFARDDTIVDEENLLLDDNFFDFAEDDGFDLNF